ncbi:right-handed parallel beta-helix repeat-containing protein [Microbulbifer sp. GL-2]|uniref:right-handed parallel beta-helix repeat-containing protein n=1 Tax=Microbulbifer sp. GL-2 TaxID=2591606 RepID=UPI00117FFEA6|nr:right-handed parallel beta-helix repeat-containing protein [Microbulbifer sp. GL-2]
MNFNHSTLINTCTTATILSAVFSISPFALAVECGDIITSTTVLSEPLTCVLTQDSPYALTVSGPNGNLKMIADGEIICDTASQHGIAGILVNGFSGLVAGGTITNCPDGLNLEGDGFHIIEDIKILSSPREGIVIDSDSNTIVRNHIIDTGNDDGIDIRGDNNKILQNYIESAGDQGITINGKFTLVDLNYIVGSFDGDSGIQINADYTTVSQNFVTNNWSNGIQISEGSSNNIVIQNFTTKNGTSGLSDRAGINISGFNNTNNQITGNTSLDNNAFDLQDLSDLNCTGKNTWTGNIFKTSNPGCLK